jgi:hypothetical protein
MYERWVRNRGVQGKNELGASTLVVEIDDKKISNLIISSNRSKL